MNFPSSQNANPNTTFEVAITSALEHQPEPLIRAEFAASVTAQAMTLPQRPHAPRAHYARSISIFISAVLLVALFVLAPYAQPSFASLSFDLELTAVAVLSALVYGLTQARKESL